MTNIIICVRRFEPVMHIIDTAFKAMEAVGVEPHVKAIRGGTDGAQLSFKRLAVPPTSLPVV